jgi:hypothetical protein
MDANPYQSPMAAGSDWAPPTEPGQPALFLPPRTMVVPLLYVGAVVSLINVAVLVMQYGLLSRAMGGENITSDEATLNDMQVGVAAILYLVVFLATVAAWWRWQLRAARNLRAFGGPLEFTPGWTIGWYFVPFANLFKPFQAMKEIYNTSDPRFAADEYRRTNNLAAGAVVAWWFLWIVGNIAGQISWRMPGESLTDLRIGSLLGIVEMGVLHLPLCLVAARMIRTINRNQLVQHRGQRIE